MSEQVRARNLAAAAAAWQTRHAWRHSVCLLLVSSLPTMHSLKLATDALGPGDGAVSGAHRFVRQAGIRTGQGWRDLRWCACVASRSGQSTSLPTGCAASAALPAAARVRTRRLGGARSSECDGIVSQHASLMMAVQQATWIAYAPAAHTGGPPGRGRAVCTSLLSASWVQIGRGEVGEGLGG